MKSDDLIFRSIDIITEYYQNNLEPFFAAISDDVLWLGPAQRQQIQGRENLIRAFMAERHELTFTMGDIKSLCVAPDNHVREVLLHYDICTHYPSGNSDMHDQRLHFTWRDKRVKTGSGWEHLPEIVMVHISNAHKYDSRDIIYPIHYETVSESVCFPPRSERLLTLKIPNTGICRITEDNVLYVETVKRSAKLRVHTKNGTFTVGGTLSEFETRCPGRFLRIHAGYLLNPSHVREIHRFFVILSDGTELPVPEKRYTQIKKQLIGESI